MISKASSNKLKELSVPPASTTTMTVNAEQVMMVNNKYVCSFGEVCGVFFFD